MKKLLVAVPFLSLFISGCFPSSVYSPSEVPTTYVVTQQDYNALANLTIRLKSDYFISAAVLDGAGIQILIDGRLVAKAMAGKDINTSTQLPPGNHTIIVEHFTNKLTSPYHYTRSFNLSQGARAEINFEDTAGSDHIQLIRDSGLVWSSEGFSGTTNAN